MLPPADEVDPTLTPHQEEAPASTPPVQETEANRTAAEKATPRAPVVVEERMPAAEKKEAVAKSTDEFKEKPSDTILKHTAKILDAVLPHKLGRLDVMVDDPDSSVLDSVGQTRAYESYPERYFVSIREKDISVKDLKETGAIQEIDRVLQAAGITQPGSTVLKKTPQGSEFLGFAPEELGIKGEKKEIDAKLDALNKKFVPVVHDYDRDDHRIEFKEDAVRTRTSLDAALAPANQLASQRKKIAEKIETLTGLKGQCSNYANGNGNQEIGCPSVLSEREFSAIMEGANNHLAGAGVKLAETKGVGDTKTYEIVFTDKENGVRNLLAFPEDSLKDATKETPAGKAMEAFTTRTQTRKDLEYTLFKDVNRTVNVDVNRTVNVLYDNENDRYVVNDTFALPARISLNPEKHNEALKKAGITEMQLRRDSDSSPTYILAAEAEEACKKHKTKDIQGRIWPAEIDIKAADIPSQITRIEPSKKPAPEAKKPAAEEKKEAPASPSLHASLAAAADAPAITRADLNIREKNDGNIPAAGGLYSYQAAGVTEIRKLGAYGTAPGGHAHQMIDEPVRLGNLQFAQKSVVVESTNKVIVDASEFATKDSRTLSVQGGGDVIIAISKEDAENMKPENIETGLKLDGQAGTFSRITMPKGQILVVAENDGKVPSLRMTQRDEKGNFVSAKMISAKDVGKAPEAAKAVTPEFKEKPQSPLSTVPDVIEKIVDKIEKPNVSLDIGAEPTAADTFSPDGVPNTVGPVTKRR